MSPQARRIAAEILVLDKEILSLMRDAEDNPSGWSRVDEKRADLNQDIAYLAVDLALIVRES